jgi:hypothetical protein
MDDRVRFPAAAAIPAWAPASPTARPDRGPPPGTVLDGGRAPVPAEALLLCLAEDHERIAVGLNDVVVRRLFAAGLDLQAALGRIDDHLAAGKIRHAVDELDQAIRDIRDTIFDHPTVSGRPGRP